MFFIDKIKLRKKLILIEKIWLTITHFATLPTNCLDPKMALF